MKIFTIGFTKKSAEQFFSKLRASGARRVVDVRLNNVPAGGLLQERRSPVLHAADLRLDYVHLPELVPT
jgi:uncharacterized protein (DUF488 family)